MTTQADARRSFRDARHALANTILTGDSGATVAAARGVLHAGDLVRAVILHPSPREQRALRRWRRFALEALRCDPPSAGLLDRVRALIVGSGSAHCSEHAGIGMSNEDEALNAKQKRATRSTL